MATVIDAARYFLDKLGQMSAWKLHKLCYYAQAWTLAWDEKPLFDEEFEAWTDGPVSPDLFNLHRGAYNIDSSRLPDGDPKAFSPSQLKNLESVSMEYGSKDANWLRDQTHSEDPWRIARGDMPADVRSNEVVTKESMRLYYGGFLPDEEFEAISSQILAENRECYRALAQ